MLPKKKIKLVPKKQAPPPEDIEEVDEIEDEEETPVVSKGKILPKKKVVASVDEDEEVDEEVDDEVEDDEGEEEAPVVSKGKIIPKKGLAVTKKGSNIRKNVSPLAAAFAAVPLTNNATDIKAGTYEAIIRAIVLQDADAKGQSVRVNVELCAPEFSEANQLVDWRKIINADGDAVGGGIRALGQDLARLGYEVPTPDEDFEENLEAIFDEITKEKPGVIVKVTYQNVGGTSYQHFSIHGPCDNEVVEAYKDNVPY